MKLNTLNVILIASTVMFSACASKSVEPKVNATEKQKATQGGAFDESKNTPEVKNEGDATLAEAKCSDLQSSSALKKYSFDLGRDAFNLCEIMKARKVSTTVVMITSPTCLSCKPVMRKIGSYVKSKDDIEFIVAVPNRHNDVESYSIEDIKEMTDENAKNAIPAFDVDAKMWLGLSEDSANPVFPLVLIINKDAKGKVIQTSEMEKENVFQDSVIPAIDKYSK